MAKRIYTEDDVRRLADGAELVLGPAALATPSALDLARQRGLRVRYGEPTASPTVPPTAPAAGPPGAGLADGSYHLEVRGGVVRIWRLTADGPREILPGGR